MFILGIKWAIWTKKGPEWAGLDFSWTGNINFPKEDHKISFYTKNQQNSTLGVFLTFGGGVKMPPGGHKIFLVQNNIKNEISTIKLLRVQIFSKIRQL